METCLRSIVLWFGVLCLTALMTSCAPPAPGGGGGGGGDGPPTGPYAPMITVADAASDEFTRLCNRGDWPDGRDEFMAYARGLDGVAQVNLHPTTGDVTIVYDNGIIHVFDMPDNIEDDLPEPDGERALSRFDPERDAPSRSIMGMPASTRATMATSHDTWTYGYSDVSDALDVISRACDHAGYDVPATPPDADVEWFRSWDDYGVIFFQGHGTMGTWNTAGGGTTELYVLQTSNRYFGAADPDPVYENDLLNNRLCLATIPTSGGRDMRVLAVSRLFFDHYCSPMQPGAVVYLNACYGLRYADEIPRTLCDAGAEMVIGWTTRSPTRRGANRAEMLFDLACGLNEVAEVEPPRRPFTIDDVYDHFVAEGLHTPDWTTHDTGEARVGFLSTYRPDSSAAPTSLRPIISEGYFVPGGFMSLVHLNGTFGEDDGQIFVGDTEIELLSWAPDRIVALTPSGDLDLVGDIVVRNPDGLESNPLRLSMYTGSMTVDVTEPRGRWSGQIDVTFSGRGIVQRVRDEIDGVPRGIEVPPVTETRLWLIEQFAMNWNISGSWQESCPDSPPPEYHNVTASGHLDEGDLGSSSGESAGFYLIVDLDLDAGTPAAPAVSYDIDDYFFRVELTDTWSGCSLGDSDWLEVYSGGPLPDAPAGADGVIPSGSDATTEYTLTWDPIRPDLVPPWGSGDDMRPARRR